MGKKEIRDNNKDRVDRFTYSRDQQTVNYRIWFHATFTTRDKQSANVVRHNKGPPTSFPRVVVVSVTCDI